MPIAYIEAGYTDSQTGNDIIAKLDLAELSSPESAAAYAEALFENFSAELGLIVEGESPVETLVRGLYALIANYAQPIANKRIVAAAKAEAVANAPRLATNVNMDAVFAAKRWAAFVAALDNQAIIDALADADITSLSTLMPIEDKTTISGIGASYAAQIDAVLAV